MNTRNRPSHQWYARMIADTLNEDFVVGPAVFSTANKDEYDAPLTVAFGMLVSLARRSKKLNIRQFAEKLSVEVDEINMIESDPSYHSRPRTISAIASFLDLPLTELMKLAGAAVSNDEAFRSKALKFAAHSDDISTLNGEEQKILQSFIRYLRDKP